MEKPLHRFDDLRAQWRATLAMYFAGATALFGTLPEAADPDPSDHRGIILIAVFFVVCGTATWAAGPRAPVINAAPFLGVVLISVMVAIAKPVGAIPYFYLWPIIAAGFFLGRRGLLVALALFYATFAAGLFISTETNKVLLFVGGAFAFTLAGGLVVWLKDQLDLTMDELRRTAATDPLTGLLNRRGLAAAFDRDLERAARMGLPLTLVVVDLDHFKLVNDRGGHAAGDATLVDTAAVLRREVRGGDVVARIGGEEFAVVLLDADAEGAVGYVERVAATAPIALSAGIASLGDEHPDREALMLAADRALYAAKNGGRGRVVVDGDAAARPLARA